MTSLEQKINNNLKESFRAGEAFKVNVLRLLVSALHNRSIEKKGKSGESELAEEEVLEVLSKEAKKRKEAIEIYLRGQRGDLSEKESKELEIINLYLPKQLEPEEIKKVLDRILQGLNPQDSRDFGRVMAEVMKELKGKADARLISQMLKERLGTN